MSTASTHKDELLARMYDQGRLYQLLDDYMTDPNATRVLLTLIDINTTAIMVLQSNNKELIKLWQEQKPALQKQ